MVLPSPLHHPSVPRLLGQGFWKHPSGVVHPFIVMEWIEGTPLYEWARVQEPSPRQAAQVLAQLARALQATHEANAVHRDVKGENVLVRRADGRAMLTDFGAGHYYGAARLTWQPQPPGTPAYQSPESGLFQRDEEGRWRMMPLYLPPPHELNPRVQPQLSALILRMLSLTDVPPEGNRGVPISS